MSSIPSKIQQQAFTPATDGIISSNQHPIALSEKRKKFIRSQSIERIIQFNSYICSQNYFILPSLIAWLKTSQTVLHSQIEKCKVSLKSIFLTSIVYKIFVDQIKICAVFAKNTGRQWYYNVSNSDCIPALEMLIVILHHSTSYLIHSVKKKVFEMSIYFTLLLIFLQLATCIFFMSKVFLPAGLIFLFVCLYLISHLNYRVLFHYLKNEENKLLSVKANKKPKKFMLGKKTISNLNLF